MKIINQIYYLNKKINNIMNSVRDKNFDIYFFIFLNY